MTEPLTNPFPFLEYEGAMQGLGEDFYDEVAAAEFPRHILRFRNDALLPLLGIEPEKTLDGHFVESFGKFEAVTPFLALRYHGYQFGEYNPFLGDGRGFLYGQVRGVDGQLYDFGTKGSGRTPYSRHADGRLTLKGGVREVLAAEALHGLGVTTSRCLCLVETGESLWRGDEPSPTRSSVMVRASRSHIRFGTFERLFHIKRPDLIRKLLDHVIEIYYPEVVNDDNRYINFYRALVERVAKLAAQWMTAGFCHGVLNTDNMSITGESFDYGPYAFIPNYNPGFTAAYFDHGGRYSFGNQPFICRLNLELLQSPLSMVVSLLDLDSALGKFDEHYRFYHDRLLLRKLGFENISAPEATDLVTKTIEILQDTRVGYHEFFATLAEQFDHGWRMDSSVILENIDLPKGDWLSWKELYFRVLNQLPIEEMDSVGDRLRHSNPRTALLRPAIESVWEAIDSEDNWQPFQELVRKLQARE
ncbi:YdiU family protein [Pannus brasiliensis CCIBt3594]|uniref:Protein nucleotidyltransferase YdiU n=1 Tax=Pannus brasiliensis CCIBt3594 TaxID=1427578 RepID=A0AAW9R087_9CHRO